MISHKRGILGILFLLIILFPLFRTSELRTKEDQFAAERDKIRHLFAKSSRQAYQYFATLDQKYGYNKPHELGHWVGAQLYAKEGIEGISFCGSSSGYSCFHGFFARAFPEEGEQLLKKADEVCGKSYEEEGNGGCFHGVGHGLLALEGYSFNNLVSALGGCDKLKGSVHAASLCRNGVFMEYNFRTMQDLENDLTMIREFNSEKPFDPCDILPSRHQSDCYFEQVAWWSQVLEQNFLEVINLCQSLVPEFQEGCFRGVGRNLAIGTEYNKEKVAEGCGKVASVKMQELCVTEAAITSMGDGIADAVELCDSLERKENCYKAVEVFNKSQ